MYIFISYKASIRTLQDAPPVHFNICLWYNFASIKLCMTCHLLQHLLSSMTHCLKLLCLKGHQGRSSSAGVYHRYWGSLEKTCWGTSAYFFQLKWEGNVLLRQLDVKKKTSSHFVRCVVKIFNDHYWLGHQHLQHSSLSLHWRRHWIQNH